MKITAGLVKGRRICSPQTSLIRPIKNKVKQALFNILGEEILEAEVLDLFAGTGQLGLESLSRGAKTALFVDHAKESITLIKKNAEKLNLLPQVSLLKKDVFKAIDFLKKEGKKFKIVFIAPPYSQGLEIKCLRKIASVLFPFSLVVVQSHRKTFFPEKINQLARIKEKNYGETKLSFFRYLKEG